MSDSVTVTNMPSLGSKEAVAFELLKYVQLNGDQVTTKDDILNLYVDCLNATLKMRPK